ncbi:MAG: hypothetical protein R3F19_17370 [Verrucomicrobiales bacterium]
MRTQKNILSQIWRMILWREWRVNRHLILNLFGLWLVVTLVLPVFVRTTPVILTCVMLGQLLAVRLAGGDSGWGSEAFSLSLPPSRGAYFWIRFLFGIVVVEVFLFVGHFATLYRIGPQIWGLVVESGVTDGAFSNDGFDSWLRAYALVLGSYAVTFAITANHGGRSVFTSTSVAGLGLWLFGTHLAGYLVYAIAFRSPDVGVPTQWDDYALSMAMVSAVLGAVAIALGALAFNRKSAGGMLPSRVLSAMLVLLIVGSVAVQLILPGIVVVWRADPESFYRPSMFRF